MIVVGVACRIAWSDDPSENGNVQGPDPAAILRRLNSGDAAELSRGIAELTQAYQERGGKPVFDALFDWARTLGPAGVFAITLPGRIGMPPPEYVSGLVERMKSENPEESRLAKEWLKLILGEWSDRRFEWAATGPIMPENQPPDWRFVELLYNAAPRDTFEMLLRRYGEKNAFELRDLRRVAHRSVNLAILVRERLATPEEIEETKQLVDQLSKDERWWVRGLAYGLADGARLNTENLRQRREQDAFYGRAEIEK
ncbi:MAG: hypothetical protein ACT4O2_09390 [Beijerinckiaceae bacterium]